MSLTQKVNLQTEPTKVSKMGVDYEDLLNQARSGAPRSVFTPHIASLCDPVNFNDTTKMRLLGNAIANSKENAAILASHTQTVDKLLQIDPLGLQILYNGTVSNPDFAYMLVQNPHTAELKPTASAKNLMGSIWEALEGTDHVFPRSLSIQLAINGFLEVLVQDTQLETDPEIIANFAKVFGHCQRCSIEDDGSDDFDTLGIRVVGNISSHKSFGLEQARSVPTEPFTWESVALLANITAELANVKGVLELWPNLVAQMVDLIRSEDPQEDELEPHEEDRTDDNEEESELEDDEEMETPFDIELWGPLLRNIARDPIASKQIAEYRPLQLYKRLLSYPTTERVGHDFVTSFAVNTYDSELAEYITSQPPNAVIVMMASAIYAGLLGESEETDMALRLAKAITKSLLESDAPESVWVKGTKTLAMISEKHPGAIDVNLLSQKAINSEPVRSNLHQVK